MADKLLSAIDRFAGGAPTHTGDATGDAALTVVGINNIILSGLGTGLLKNTTLTGAPSIALAGTDYVVPTVVTLGSLTTAAGGAFGSNAFNSTPYQPLDSDLTSWAGVTRGAGFDTAVAITVGSAGAFLLNNGSAANLTSLPTLNQNTSGTAAGLSATLTVTSGGTGRATGTTAYGLIAAGTTATGAQQTLAAGATTEMLVGGGASALPVWTTATGTGAPARVGGTTFTGTTTMASAAISDSTTSNDKDSGALVIQNGGLGVEGRINSGLEISSLQYITAGYGFRWGSISVPANFLDARTNGIYGLKNAAESAGISFDIATDGVLKLRNRSNTAATGNLDVGGTSTFTGDITTQGYIAMLSTSSQIFDNNGHWFFKGTGVGTPTRGLRFSNTAGVFWSNTNNGNDPVNAGFYQYGAGVIGLGNGSSTTDASCSLRLTNLTALGTLAVTGDATFSAKVIAGAQVRLKGYTVATLPGSPTQGDTAFVTDALAPSFLVTIVGGGSVVTQVMYDGTNWKAQ